MEALPGRIYSGAHFMPLTRKRSSWVIRGRWCCDSFTGGSSLKRGHLYKPMAAVYVDCKLDSRAKEARWGSRDLRMAREEVYTRVQMGRAEWEPVTWKPSCM